MALRSALIPFARNLRTNQTDAERRLWTRLRGRQLGGAKFRRQEPIGPYVADFCCLEPKLIVELDGGQHADQTAADAQRTEFLERSGFRVLRFWNTEVLQNMEGVLERIAQEYRATETGRRSGAETDK